MPMLPTERGGGGYFRRGGGQNTHFDSTEKKFLKHMVSALKKCLIERKTKREIERYRSTQR